METIVYRKIDASPWIQERHASEGASSTNTADMTDSVREIGALSLDLFFPVVTEEEMVTWTHWLPTCMVFDCASLQSPAEVIGTLTQLKAPPEVLEEFHWSWKLGLFEAYEVRTPVRHDVRDPLLLGRVGEQCYRLALWGESLLPLEQITALVQQSLALRTRVEKRKGWVALGGTLFGLAVGLLWASLSPETQPVGISLLFAFVGFFLAWLPTFLYTPENRQHDFLDRYRC
jgi:hypothetical protein